MRVAAVMVVRNELPYLGNCLRHLADNGLDFYVIDNQSDDGTSDLLRSSRFSRNLIGTETYPFDGAFDWRGLIAARERASRRLDADWVLFVSADEMMHSYVANERLADAIARIARDGSNVIDFNEFVFLPVDQDYVSECSGFPPIDRYYFFEPRKPRLQRARRADLQVSQIGGGGHNFIGEYRQAEETMALRHYLVRDQEHAYRKYVQRVFRADELAIGWHRNRHQKEERAFTFPASASLHRLDNVEDRNLDRSRPRKTHYWQWTEEPAAGSPPHQGCSEKEA